MWKKLSSKTLLSHSRLIINEDTVELPSGETINYLTFGQTKKHAALIICVRGDEILLAKEYSYPTGKVLYEFPGGASEGSETPLETARRELIEEVGFEANTFEDIGWFYLDNRRSSLKLYVFVAQGCRFAQKQGGDIEEDISSQWVAVSQVNDMIKNGKIVNPTLLAAWAIYYARFNKK